MDPLHELATAKGRLSDARRRIRELEKVNASLRSQLDTYDRRARLAEASVRTAWRQVAAR